MQGDIDSIAKNVMKTPQGLKIIVGLDKFNTALSSENGRQMLALLAGDAGAALKTAAAQALSSPKDNGRVLLSGLLSSKDGAALLGKMIELLGA